MNKKIDACEKVERKDEQSTSAKKKNESKHVLEKLPHKRAIVRPFSAGLPGVTRYSTIVGLKESPSNKKWNLFLYEGPYWNYLVNYIQRKNIFRGRQDRVEEAVMNACEKIGKFMVAKRYKYPEEGKGHFRGFIKVVTLRTAFDLYKEISRQENMLVNESDADKRCEFDKMYDDMKKATAKCRKRPSKANAAQGVADEIASSPKQDINEQDLDNYDASAGFSRRIAPARNRSVIRLDDNPFSDDEAPSNYNPADIFAAMTQVAEEDLAWVQKLQIHVLYIALGHVLTNENVSADQREMLRLRYGLDMRPQDIYALPRFNSMARNAFDVKMSRATEKLRKEAASWWRLVAPNENDFANETVMRFWRELGRTDERAKIAINLQDKAIEVAGRIQ